MKEEKWRRIRGEEEKYENYIGRTRERRREEVGRVGLWRRREKEVDGGSRGDGGGRARGWRI